MKRSLLIAIAILATIPLAAQGWQRTEYRDQVANRTVVMFTLKSDDQAAIQISCSGGKTDSAWLVVGEVLGAYDFNPSNTRIEYRRDGELSSHMLELPMATGLTSAELANGRITPSRLEALLYGPFGFGGGEWRKNKKANNWAKTIFVKIPIFPDTVKTVRFTFSDPAAIYSECAR